MNFNIIKTHSIYGKMDYMKESEAYLEKNDIVPVPDDIFESMRENASNIDNLCVTATIGDQGSHIYVEATEFFTFCEASDMTPDQAANAITAKYSVHNPELDNAEFHVVFPSDCINKNILGGENLGKSVSDNYAMQLIRGCRRYGLKVNIGKESDYPVSENAINISSDEVLSESDDLDKLEKTYYSLTRVADKAYNTIDKDAAERAEIINKVNAAKEAIEKYNAKRKKDKKKKYTDIKDKK